MVDHGRSARGTLVVILARAAIALVVVGAALGVVALLTGNLSKLHAKIILTTWSGSFFLTCALACLAAVEQGSALKSRLGLVTSLGGFLLFLHGVWQQGYLEVWFWKWLWYLVVLSVTLAQTSLLGVDRKQAGPARKISSLVAEGAAWTLCFTTIYMVAKENGDDPALWRTVGVSSLIDLAGTLVVLILRRVEGRGARSAE